MAIKHILTPVSGERDAVHVALYALRLAEDLKAHVTATNIPLSATPSIVPEAAISPGAYGQLWDILDDINAQCAARARGFFDNAVALTKTPIVDTPVCARASTTWRDIARLDDTSITALGRLADLIIMDKPADGGADVEMTVFEDIVFGARRPALLVPVGTTAVKRDNIAIAWNGSREAAEAARCATDFMTPETKITVIQVGDLRGDHMPADALMDYLGWHCHVATLRKIADKSAATADVILAEAKSAGAQMLVAGAYSHNRTRELLLGGVTRRFLARADLPLLMAH